MKHFLACAVTLLLVAGCDEAGEEVKEVERTSTEGVKEEKDWLGKLEVAPQVFPANSLGSNYPKIIWDIYKKGQKDDYEKTEDWSSRIDNMQTYVDNTYGDYFVFKLSIIGDDWSFDADSGSLTYDNEYASGVRMLDESVETSEATLMFAIAPKSCSAISFKGVSADIARSVRDISYRMQNNLQPTMYVVGEIDASKEGYNPPDGSTAFDLADGGFENVPGVKSMASPGGYGSGPSLRLSVDFEPSKYVLVDGNTGEILAESNCS